VLLLDDLHWADLGSLDLLRALARQLADLPLLLIVTYRDDELTRRHPLYQLLPLLEREARATRLDLRRLDAASIGALVVARYDLPATDIERLTDWLLVRAEGNAFFTTQLLRALEDRDMLRCSGDVWALGELDAVGLPAPLRQVLDARLDRIGEAARQLLALAAVLGQEVPLGLWAAVADTDEDGLLDAIERAVEARLLEALASGEAVRFAHATRSSARRSTRRPCRCDDGGCTSAPPRRCSPPPPRTPIPSPTTSSGLATGAPTSGSSTPGSARSAPTPGSPLPSATRRR
jgi:predicted ATPase